MASKKLSHEEKLNLKATIEAVVKLMVEGTEVGFTLEMYDECDNETDD